MSKKGVLIFTWKGGWESVLSAEKLCKVYHERRHIYLIYWSARITVLMATFNMILNTEFWLSFFNSNHYVCLWNISVQEGSEVSMPLQRIFDQGPFHILCRFIWKIWNKNYHVIWNVRDQGIKFTIDWCIFFFWKWRANVVIACCKSLNISLNQSDGHFWHLSQINLICNVIYDRLDKSCV